MRFMVTSVLQLAAAPTAAPSVPSSESFSMRELNLSIEELKFQLRGTNTRIDDLINRVITLENLAIHRLNLLLDRVVALEEKNHRLP